MVDTKIKNKIIIPQLVYFWDAVEFSRLVYEKLLISGSCISTKHFSVINIEWLY
jgi:hypothetical protein